MLSAIAIDTIGTIGDIIDETIDIITDSTYSSRQELRLMVSRSIDAKDTIVDSYRNHRKYRQ